MTKLQIAGIVFGGFVVFDVLLVLFLWYTIPPRR